MTETRRRIPATAAGDRAASPYRVKLVDPNFREEWTHPLDPTFTATLRPVAIPTMSADRFIIAEAYLNRGVVEVRNPDPLPVPVGGWGGPNTTLPGDVQTAFMLILQRISHLTEDERQD